MSEITDKTADIIGSVLLIVLMFPTIIYGNGYANQIYADVTIDLATRSIVRYIPLLLAVVELFFALLLFSKTIKK